MRLTNEQIIALERIKEELAKPIYKDNPKLNFIKEDNTLDADYLIYVKINHELSNIIIHPDGQLAVSLITNKKRKLIFIDDDEHQYSKAVFYFLQL
ncbi:MAG TPA: hypothetical protein PKD00_01350 [Burkholderiales bacterium]|nr:hypothetical protein [Burkholderiales bacterium]